MQGAKADTALASGFISDSGTIAVPAHGVLFDLSQVDTRTPLLDRQALQDWIPHRGAMQ